MRHLRPISVGSGSGVAFNPGRTCTITFQVGKMTKDGQPYAREQKLYDEVEAMNPNDRVIFVDEADTTRRAVYDYGVDPKTVRAPSR